MQLIDFAIPGLALAAIQALVSWWIQARLTASIKLEYDTRFEKLKREYERKEKGAAVAELLAEWTHLKEADTKRLNQLLWELSLWLPAHLVRDVTSMVIDSPNRKTPLQVLVAVRAHLWDDVDPISEQDIAHFKHPDNSSMQSISDTKKS